MSNIDKIYYALQDNEGNLIGIDSGSGGYPWVPSTPYGVWYAEKPNEMIKYNNMSGFRQFKLVKVKITINEEV